MRADGAGISGANVSTTSRDGTRPTLFAATDAAGAFGVALLPGLYDLEAPRIRLRTLNSRYGAVCEPASG